MNDLAALAARHVRNNFGACMDCAPKPWPCDARQIADALAEARKEAQRRWLQWTELVNKTEAEVAALRAENDRIYAVIDRAIDLLNTRGDPIAAYLTLVGAHEPVEPIYESPAPNPDDECTCGHLRRQHTNRDVDDVVGWPCRVCKSKRCRGFALIPVTEEKPDGPR